MTNNKVQYSIAFLAYTNGITDHLGKVLRKVQTVFEANFKILQKHPSSKDKLDPLSFSELLFPTMVRMEVVFFR